MRGVWGGCSIVMFNKWFVVKKVLKREAVERFFFSYYRYITKPKKPSSFEPCSGACKLHKNIYVTAFALSSALIAAV